ncbi:sigma-54 interaction domain-containing protein [Desulfosarcina ovata]|uniref:Fis family transcriptional regulator n=2 Tax=Desulfosarcina ovata TaxID=83564 RepID=A0A5K8A6V1_9BACT|nr:sigma 54-interacting transcriptional regulator [Desulfosarcina ovata]BBO80757.1 Fis family transcriptional regulator [Desulfosarcina ovata subsp. sediminis]BBO88201.1 Fis family transcriptional regulator [Desulfosarcina ovata subsp. ovata]
MKTDIVDTPTPIDHLKAISSWVSSVQDLDKLLHLIIESATNVVRAEAASLLLMDTKTNTLYFKVATGTKGKEVKEFRVKLGEGIAGHVAQTGQALLIADAQQDSRWMRTISDRIDFETRSMACVPLKINDRTIGVVQVINKQDDSRFSQADMDVLEEFSNLAALAIGSARSLEQVRQENQDLKKKLGEKHQIIGKSLILDKVLKDAQKLSRTKTTALIQGESGTGKELVARLIHRESPRRDKPLVVLNCAALPEPLLESELFGHEKGAFTGATSRKIGKFEAAHEGSLFLDEIGEMAPGIQAKLLRVLQEGVFYRVGGNTPITVDVRVLSATNKDLKKEVEEGNFREDLFYRLNVVQLDTPPLRERLEDVPFLVNHFLEVFKKETGLLNLTVSQDAMDKMTHYEWPGNIRELRNAIERAVVMGDGKTILPEDLPISASLPKFAGLRVGLTLDEALNEFKKEFILLNLQHTGGNRSKAAKIMDIQRTYLSRLITRYGMRDLA